jgi:hypothetical protein
MANESSPSFRYSTFKELTMKRTSLLNRSVFAALLLSVSVSVFAGVPTATQSAAQPVAVATSSSDLLLAAVDRSGGPLSATSADPADAANTADAVAATGNLGKTRAQVRAELIQAEQQGLVPSGNTRYPAGPSLISRNAYNFRQAQSWWTAHGQGAAWGS